MNLRERCGPLGKGTAGKRLKSAWRNEGGKMSLRSFALLHSELTDSHLFGDAAVWLESK